MCYSIVILTLVEHRRQHLVGAFLRGVAYHPHRGKPFGAAVGAAEVFLQTLGAYESYPFVFMG